MVQTKAAGLPGFGFGSVTDRLLERNRLQGWSQRVLTDRRPRLGLAIITCMDCRIDVYDALGLGTGDAHVLRNAGGLVTDDTIRSLVVSQRLLGTREVMIVHHTDCGLHGLDEAAFAREIADQTCCELPFRLGAFADLDEDVRESIRRLRESPFAAEPGSIRGFVYDVETGLVREVRI